MKNIAIILFLTLSSVVSATSWYISPSGNDSNNGSVTSPFFTLNKAWSVASAGDIIYARGGVYKFNSRQNLTGKNGTSSDTIRIWAYPGERPVFTKSSTFTTPSWPVCLIYVKADYIHIRGIEVAYFTQKSATIWYGIAVQGSDHNKFERINSHHNGHGMVIRDESNHNLVLNCDFHHNFDPLNSYGDGDGLEVGYQSASMENTIRGCRLWRNADDGIDLWQNNGNVVIDRCWSWSNGFREDGITSGGDGGGFKFGSTTTQDGTQFKRTIKNSVAFYNRTRGFNQNGANVKFYFYNNIAWKNPRGFDFYAYNLPHVFRNNVVFENNTNWSGSYSNAIKDHNSYDSGFSSNGPAASASDFLTLDTTGISKARKANGDLPDINFMKLAPGSDLIDAGTNVGTLYAGSAPDLGAFETGSSAATPTPPATPAIILAYQNSTVKNTTPSEIEVVYNLSIAPGIVPPASSYEVKINSQIRSISKLTIKDKNVYITLSSPVVHGDLLTLSYTKPSTSALQCTGGTFAESISAKSVINLVEAAPASDSTTAESPAPAPSDTTRTDPVSTPLPSDSTASAPPPSSQSPDEIVNSGQIAILTSTASKIVSITNFIPEEGSILKIYNFSGKVCQETRLTDATQVKNIPLTVAPGYYKAEIKVGESVQHVQKMIVVN